ncbi:MAG: XdhC family protein [Acidimicrobiales bacterium]
MFVHVLVEPPRLVIVGAGDVSIALAAVAKVLGCAVTVCDPRPVFADAARFPAADHLVVEWPDHLLTRIGAMLGPRDPVCILAHDPKFEVPAVAAALGTEVGYVGVLSSRRTVTARRARLRDAGLGDDALDRVMEPIDLDIGAPKALVEVGGRPLVESGATTLLAGGCRPVVVAGAAAAPCADGSTRWLGRSWSSTARGGKAWGAR